MARPGIQFTTAIIATIVLLVSVSGFAQIHPGNLAQFTAQDGVPNSEVNRLLLHRCSYIWVGTINGLAEVRSF